MQYSELIIKWYTQLLLTAPLATDTETEKMFYVKAKL